jgi:FkbM family methyltransferase
MTTGYKKLYGALRRLTHIDAFAEIFKFDNRWQLLIDEFIAGRALKIYRINGVDALADHRTGDHLGGLRGVLASSEYRSLLAEIPLDTVKTVVDLGANVGGFTLLLKVLGAPLERVVCVEPGPASRVKLQFNLQHNEVPAEIFAGAASNHPGVAKLYVGMLSTGSSLLPNHGGLGDGSIEVETITLDLLVERYFPRTIIDICKMDIEGAEFEILLGENSKTLAGCRYLICEIHPTPQHSQSDLVDALRKRGFVLIPCKKGNAHNETVLFRNENGPAAA